MNHASASSLADPLPPPAAPPCPPPLALSAPDLLPVAILGVPFDHVTIDRAVERIEGMIASRQPHYVVTANVDFLVQAHRDVELRRILREADLVLCDGTPLVWASRWLGNPLPERVAGSDLAPALIRAAAKKGHRLFLLGAGEGVAAEACVKLKQQHPDLNIVGHYAPPFSDLLGMDHDAIVSRVRAARPDILLVSFGCPKQEKWIAMHHRTLGVPVSIGVGATIDFLAGRMKRAPGWMRHTGTEWLFRLWQEPRRLYKRYAQDFAVFLPTLAAQWWQLGSRSHTAAGPREVPANQPDWRRIDAGRLLTRAALEAERTFWRNAQRAGEHCLLDLSRVQCIDGTGVAFLIRWRNRLLARGRQLVLLAPPPGVHRTFESLRLEDYFHVTSDAQDAARHAAALIRQPTVQRDGTTRALAWCGEIVAANAPDVWQVTSEHIQTFITSGATLVIVDIARLRFIDSSGAALMLRIKQWARGLEAQVMFANPQPNIRNVLRLTRLDQLLLEGAQ